MSTINALFSFKFETHSNFNPLSPKIAQTFLDPKAHTACFCRYSPVFTVENHFDSLKIWYLQPAHKTASNNQDSSSISKKSLSHKKPKARIHFKNFLCSSFFLSVIGFGQTVTGISVKKRRFLHEIRYFHVFYKSILVYTIIQMIWVEQLFMTGSKSIRIW